ncbi:hypothetical protein ASD78_14365 [Lysobacter sp. Root667]|nr:hypothetical protein ASD78_14365 [Lysobacter sp. Root667]
MEAITHAFQSISCLIEVFSLLIAVAGFYIAFRGYKAAGAMIGVGSGLHALGYFLLMHGSPQTQLTPIKSFVISAMHPGLLLLTVGVCYLALTLQRRRGGT